MMFKIFVALAPGTNVPNYWNYFVKSRLVISAKYAMVADPRHFSLEWGPDPNPPFHYNMDPASHQSDAILRSLIYRPFRALFGAFTPPMRATMALHSLVLSI